MTGNYRDSTSRCWPKCLWMMFVLLTTFPGLATAFTREAFPQAYDDAGELVSVEHSAGPKLRYAYRKDGALMEAAADDVVVTFERDALGQIVKESVTGIEDDTEDWVASAYDHRGLRLRLESSRGSAVDIVRNPMGDVTSVSYGDEAHRWSATFSRDRLGLEIDRVVGSGASAVRGYWWRDALGRPTQHWVGQASAPEGASPASHRLRKYRWDPGDLLRSLEDDALGSIAYEHDVRGFLQKAEVTPKDGGEARVELRNPDDVGNLFASLDRSDREYGKAGQVLKRSAPQSEGGGVTTYRYDADGNMAERVDPDGGRWWFHWNGAGQLAQVDKPGGTAVTFRYDAFGRRVEKNADGVITRWVWDGNLPLHEWRGEGEPPEVLRTPELRGRRTGLLRARERLGNNEAWFDMLRARSTEDAEFGWLAQECLTQANPPPPADDDGVITWLFEPESFSPLARVSEKRGAMAVFTDHLGTPLCLTDAAGAVTWQGVTDTYGRCTVTDGDATLCPWRFPGQYEDAETALFYNRFRYYDPGVGGYISRDPIGPAGGLAVHGYVDDPLTWVDPFGLTKAPGPGGSCGGGVGSGPGKKGTRTKNRLPEGRNGDLGPANGMLEKRNPQTGELQQKRFFDENGQPEKDIDFGHDHGAGDPHAHDWTRQSPQQPNPSRQPGRPLAPGEIDD